MQVHHPEILSGERENNGIISVFNTHEEAEIAIKEIQQSGFNMERLSIVGRDFQTEEKVIGYYNIGNRTMYWGKQGAFWGGLWGILVGSAFFIVPGIGPLVVAGTFATAIFGAIEGAIVVGGLSVLGAALYSVGIPKDSIVEYETAVTAGKYVMIAHGPNKDLKKAREIVNKLGVMTTSSFDFNH